MTSIDIGLSHLRSAADRVTTSWDRFGRWVKNLLPSGLYARAVLIIIAPMVILQSVVAFVFMERHWNTVTRRLSAAVVQDVAALIDVYNSFGVRSRTNRSIELPGDYHVTSTPTLVVDGKYLMTPAMAGSYERFFQLLDQVIAMARKERAAKK